MYLAAGAQIAISPHTDSRQLCPVLLLGESVVAAPHGCGGVGGLEDSQGKLSQTRGLRGYDVRFHCPLRQLVLQLQDNGLPSSNTVGGLEKSLRRECGSLRQQTKLEVVVCVVLLDIVPPGDHLGKIRLDGVRCETALGLQAETVRELFLGPPGNDPPTYPGPRIVGAVEAEPPLLLTHGEEPRVVSAALHGVPPCLGDEIQSVFETTPLQVLRVPKPSEGA